MTDEVETTIGAQIARSREIIRQYSVGFIGVDDASVEQPSRSLGSGTLMQLAGVHGVLTAAHVAELLPRQERIGILRFRDGLMESLVFPTTHLDVLMIGGGNSGEHGPDIAFVKLPPEAQATLQATNVFFSPDAHGERMLQRRGGSLGPVQARFVAGVLDHFTEVLPARGNVYRMSFTSLTGWGEIVERGVTADGFDWFEFALIYEDGVIPPPTYGGVSGGSVWQLIDDTPPLHRNVIGVPFRESNADANGHRRLICHGPKSIYEVLLPEVAKRWNLPAWEAWQAATDT
jgi:hypothetical protein